MLRVIRHRVLSGSFVAFMTLGGVGTADAAEHYGLVTFGAVPVPGATVSATRGDRRVQTASDEQGIYRFADLADGVWTVQVSLFGFSVETRDVVVAPDAPAEQWSLTLRSFDELARGLPLQAVDAPAEPTAAPPSPPRPGEGSAESPQAFQRAEVNALAPAAATTVETGGPTDQGDGSALGAMGAADGLLVNGSVNNAAASPFSQLAAFGNNRRRPGSLYNGGLGVLAGNSAWDARPFSFTGQPTSKPHYSDVHVIATFGGPIRIPGVQRNVPTVFVGYQRTSDSTATTRSALMPTLLERRGDFSQTRDAFGRPVRVVDPTTGLPFPGGIIPSDRVSAQAAALLGYYPSPNLGDGDGFNYQRTVLTSTTQQNAQARVTQPVNTRNQLFGTVAYQRVTTAATNLFGFDSAREVSDLNAAANWSYRLSQFLSLRTRAEFTRVTSSTTPYFAGRTNVSAAAGIAGNSQDPADWGPPSLVFSNGMAGLSDTLPDFTRNQVNAWSAEALSSRGRHFVTAGGTVRRHQINIRSQLNPRGEYGFTGDRTGHDFADFLLGAPQTSTIAFGNADKDLSAYSYDAYVNDDWRVSPGLTFTVGLRWEYEAPLTERLDRLVNLDVASGFSVASPVLAGDTIGTVTGRRYNRSLLAPDRLGFQPRLALAWRPVPGSSLVIRAGYGIYRNTRVYESITTLMAQQPPFSKALSVDSSEANLLSLADGFSADAGRSLSTFGVDPGFRVGFAQIWQVSAQRDLPASLTVIGTYRGARGSRLLQQVLPNSYPAGVATPCATCPTGFVYLTSNGRSSQHAGEVQVRRRLRNGLTASVQYTLSKATDDAAAFGGANLAGASIAQDWLDPRAEFGPSAFDQRHRVVASVQYTTGVGVGGGALLDGLAGTLWKGWTATGQVTTGSGVPLTPIYLTSVGGTGVTGTVRAALTGEPTTAPAGFYLNPAAYAPPESGRWGSAGRNSVTGPSQFDFDAGLARTFDVSADLSLDWRVDAINLLNRVTYASVNTLVGSPQFGLPDRANPMRRVQTSLRLRF